MCFTKMNCEVRDLFCLWCELVDRITQWNMFYDWVNYCFTMALSPKKLLGRYLNDVHKNVGTLPHVTVPFAQPISTIITFWPMPLPPLSPQCGCHLSKAPLDVWWHGGACDAIHTVKLVFHWPPVPLSMIDVTSSWTDKGDTVVHTLFLIGRNHR